MPTTILNWVEYVSTALDEAQVFFGHGTDNAWDEACALVGFALYQTYDISDDIAQNSVTPLEGEKIKALLDRRIKERKPLAYLTHEAWLLDVPFYVDERVLIPRSPIASFIKECFEPWLSKQVHRILDIGTGSGCLAILSAMAFEKAQVDALDVSTDCLAVAKCNVERHEMASRIQLIHSDLFSNLTPSNQYDIILSNPPYVGDEEMHSLPPEYRHEPKLALASGQDGFDFVRKLMREAPNFLTPQGILVVEVGYGWQKLAELMPDMPFIWLIPENGGEGIFLLTREMLDAG